MKSISKFRCTILGLYIIFMFLRFVYSLGYSKQYGSIIYTLINYKLNDQSLEGKSFATGLGLKNRAWFWNNH